VNSRACYQLHCESHYDYTEQKWNDCPDLNSVCRLGLERDFAKFLNGVAKADDSLSCRVCDANYTCLCVLEILKPSSSCPASFICWDNPLSEINMFICSQKVSLLSVNCTTIINKWTVGVNFEMDCMGNCARPLRNFPRHRLMPLKFIYLAQYQSQNDKTLGYLQDRYPPYLVWSKDLFIALPFLIAPTNGWYQQIALAILVILSPRSIPF